MRLSRKKKVSEHMKKISPEQKVSIQKNIDDISTARSSFFMMLILSTIIASYGLLSNSTAVVIGAMLVAPLMGPIFGIGLGLSTGDSRLMRKAALAEVIGVIIAVAIGTGIGLLPWRLEFGSEIVARVQPTLYDIIIALASGMAGAYAFVDERVSPSLPGVAIATALVPPLATCGLCLSAGKWQFALGAFLLFFANFLAIELAASIIFVLSGMSEAQPHAPYSVKAFIKRFGFSLVALLIVGAFMTKTLVTVVQTQRLRESIKSTLSRELRTTLGAHLTDLRYDEKESRLQVIASVLTPQEFKPTQVARMEMVLWQVDPRIDLIIRSLISKDADRNGIVFVEKSKLQREELEREQQEKERARAEMLQKITHVLNNQLKSLLGAQLDDIQYEEGENGATVKASVDTPMVIEPLQVKLVEKALREELGADIHLIIRSVLVRDVDAENFLYEDIFLNQASAIVRAELQRVRGAELVSVKRETVGHFVLLTALVNTPTAINPSNVKKIEQVLRKSMGDFIKLTVRSVLTRDADSNRYIYTEALSRPGGR